MQYLSKMKKITSLILSMAFVISFASCKTDTGNSLASISLTKDMRSWSNPGSQYKELLDEYGSYTCNGAVVVATDKDVVYLYGEDAVEKDGKTLVSQDTIFDLASMSKTFTAVLILKLQEEGKLNVEDTLDKYFPEYEAGKNTKIYNLLHMNSGISDYINNIDPFWNISGADAANKKISDILNDRVTDEEFLKALYQAPLEFEPGTQFSYSNTNYRLLAFIIEKTAGVKYCDYAKKKIFDVCGMTKTTSMATDDLTYVPFDYDILVKYDFTDKNGYINCPNNTRGDGGIHSCLTDVLAFDRALFGGKLLSKKSMEILLKEESGYCMGLNKTAEGYSHNGASYTCSGNNKIIESEKFGHIYVISLEHIGSASDKSASYTLAELTSGTKYSKGTFNDGVYVNEYAGLKVKIREDLHQISDDEMAEDKVYLVSKCTTAEDKARENATIYDMAFDSQMLGMKFSFVNTRFASPGDPGYDETKYLDGNIGFIKGKYKSFAITVEYHGRAKTVICGKEYLRDTFTLSGNEGVQTICYYARKLDDNLISVVELYWFGKKTAEEQEKFFE